MSRLFLVVFAAVFVAAWPPVQAQSASSEPDEELTAEAETSADPAPANVAKSSAFGRMMSAIAARDWDKARVAAAVEGPLLERYVLWNRLRAGDGNLQEYMDFLADHPDWPGLELMHDRGERAIGEGEDPARVVAYFGDKLPETALGVLRLVEAHAARGEDGDAAALAVLAWRTRTLTAQVEQALLSRYEKLLAPHHEARLDDLLWRDQRAAALRQMPRVGEDWQKLAEARQALRTRAAGVDAKIEAVPEALRNHPGLAWERYNWRIRKRLNDTAIDLLAEYSTNETGLGRPQMWANYRRIYARGVLREGDAVQAYALASRHFLVEGSDYADLEWLSGWIALRFLKDPELALWHFQRFRDAVETPISLGRAGYWIGRAYTDLGEEHKAQDAYAFGAKYQTSYYGLLAAEAAGLPMDPTLTGREVFPDWRATSFANSDVLKIGLKMIEEGERAIAERFLTHLSESLSRSEAGSLGALMIDGGHDYLALKIAKRVARGGVMIPAAYYPLHPIADAAWPVPTELALSIARRESEFDPVVVSPAGARGLMQLMPGTAKDMAGELKVSFDAGKLTEDSEYNAQLGTAYLAGLIEIFGDSPVLVAAGYNAGPGRAVNWVGDRGDPRYPGIDVVDWIEMIPFRETRNYVMRVTESLPVYKARLSGHVEPLNFTKLLHGVPN